MTLALIIFLILPQIQLSCHYFYAGPTLLSTDIINDNIIIGDVMEISFELQLNSQCPSNFCHILKIGDSSTGYPRLPLIDIDARYQGFQIVFSDTTSRNSNYEIRDSSFTNAIIDGNYHIYYFKWTPTQRIFVFNGMTYKNSTGDFYDSTQYYYQQYQLLVVDSSSPHLIVGNMMNLCINSSAYTHSPTNSPTTSIPTNTPTVPTQNPTYVPSTSIPTTDMPTPSTPTTNVPSTNLPTTSIPTTDTPTITPRTMPTIVSILEIDSSAPTLSVQTEHTVSELIEDSFEGSTDNHTHDLVLYLIIVLIAGIIICILVFMICIKTKQLRNIYQQKKSLDNLEMTKQCVDSVSTLNNTMEVNKNLEINDIVYIHNEIDNCNDHRVDDIDKTNVEFIIKGNDESYETKQNVNVNDDEFIVSSYEENNKTIECEHITDDKSVVNSYGSSFESNFKTTIE